MRPRPTTMKCISQKGELLEIAYKKLMDSVKLDEGSCQFLERFVNNKDRIRVNETEAATERHCLSENIDTKSSEHAQYRFGKTRKYLKEKPIVITGPRHGHVLNISSTISIGFKKADNNNLKRISTLSYNSTITGLQLSKKTSAIFKYTEAQEKYVKKKTIRNLTLKKFYSSKIGLLPSTTRPGTQSNKISFGRNRPEGLTTLHSSSKKKH